MFEWYVCYLPRYIALGFHNWTWRYMFHKMESSSEEHVKFILSYISLTMFNDT